MDTYCRTLTFGDTIPDNYSITGLVKGDNELLSSGTIILYKEISNYYLPVDADIVNNGEYSFNNVEEGNYIMYAIPNIFGTQKYLPTYYQNKLLWNRADVIYVNSSLYEVDIQLRKSFFYTGGIGSIAGKVSIDGESDLKSTLSTGEGNIPVFLYSENGNVVNYTMTDNQGNYSFNNLYYGTYTVHPELPNFSMNEELKVVLSPGSPSITDFEITVNKNGTISNTKNIEDMPVISCFYSKMTDNLEIITHINGKLRIEIVNYLGQVVFTDVIESIADATKYLDVSKLPKNQVYIVNLTSEKELMKYKLLK